MKVGDLVQYIRDMPSSFVEFQNGIPPNSGRGALITSLI